MVDVFDKLSDLLGWNLGGEGLHSRGRLCSNPGKLILLTRFRLAAVKDIIVLDSNLIKLMTVWVFSFFKGGFAGTDAQKVLKNGCSILG